MLRFLFTLLSAVLITACGESAPPVINSKASTDLELKTYINTNCQDKYKMHPYCLDATNELKSRNYIESLNKPGALGAPRSAEEIFGKKQKK